MLTIGSMIGILEDKPDDISLDEWYGMPVVLECNGSLIQACIEDSGVIEMNVADEEGVIQIYPPKEPDLAFIITPCIHDEQDTDEDILGVDTTLN